MGRKLTMENDGSVMKLFDMSLDAIWEKVAFAFLDGIHIDCAAYVAAIILVLETTIDDDKVGE